MLEKQKSLCAICGVSDSISKLFVDHNHQTGKVRELLCSKCNAAIGFLNEDIALLDKAKVYIIKHMEL